MSWSCVNEPSRRDAGVRACGPRRLFGPANRADEDCRAVCSGQTRIVGLPPRRARARARRLTGPRLASACVKVLSSRMVRGSSPAPAEALHRCEVRGAAPRAQSVGDTKRPGVALVRHRRPGRRGSRRPAARAGCAPLARNGFLLMGDTGLEPVTSALSRRRSPS